MSPAIGAATSGKTRGGFKSSPLNQSPLDVAGGLVVAEEAKREMQSANEVEGSGYGQGEAGERREDCWS